MASMGIDSVFKGLSLLSNDAMVSFSCYGRNSVESVRMTVMAAAAAMAVQPDPFHFRYRYTFYNETS